MSYVAGSKNSVCLGTLAAKTASLPSQPVTSHPVIKTDLASGERNSLRLTSREELL